MRKALHRQFMRGLTFILLLSIPGQVLADSATEVAVVIGGKELPVKATAIDGKVYLPVGLLDSLGAKYELLPGDKPDSRKAKITSASGAEFSCETRMIDDEPAVPILDIATQLGAVADWSKATKRLSIRARVERIEFDGSQLSVKASYPIGYEVSTWNNKLIVDLRGVRSLESDRELAMVNSTKVPIRLGTREDRETGRIVLDTPKAVKYRVGGAAKTSEIVVSVMGLPPEALRPAPGPKAAAPSNAKPAPPPPPPISVTNVDYRKRDSKHLDVYLATGGRVKYTTGMLRRPDQLIISLHNAVLSREFNEISVDHEILKAIRLEQTTRRAEDQGQNLVTVAMDLSRIVAFDVRQDEAPSRLVIGLELPKHAAGVLAGKTVVIDPGHGGSDVGAKGCNGSVEKEVNLQIASRLHKLLVERGVCALVTRKSDTDVALSKRVPYAVQHSADFFISVHSNWCNPVASGVETFHHESGKSGRALAYCVHSEIMAVTDLPDRKVKSDYVRFPNMGMKVLRDAAASGIPAILIEGGFINHPVDYGRITDPDYQQKMAQAIFRGLKAYVEGNPNDPEPVRPSRSPADLGGVEEPEPKSVEEPPAGVRSAPEQVESPPSAAPEPLDSTSGPKRPGEK